MKWLRNIKKSNAGKTSLYIFRSLKVKKVELKLGAPTGGVQQSAFNNFAKFAVKHLC